MLRGNNIAMKYAATSLHGEVVKLLLQPVHQDDADNGEGDDDGEEIGRGYAVCPRLGPAAFTLRGSGGPAGLEHAVGVVAVKHHTVGDVITLQDNNSRVRTGPQDPSRVGRVAPHRSREEPEAGERPRRVSGRRRRVDGLREDQEQA